MTDQTRYNETFECQACYAIGPLNEHGRCVRCGSDAVITQALLEVLAYEHL